MADSVAVPSVIPATFGADVSGVESNPPLLPPTLRVSVLLPIVFLLSGSAALVYEVVWTHQFANVLGSTSESVTLVFSVYLAFLALGGYVCGRSKALTGSPVRAYAGLELGIALAGAYPTLLLLQHEFTLVHYLPHPESPVLRIVALIAVVGLVIGPGAFLMGGTLPLMTEVVKRWYLPSHRITLLYGLNTAGAACGALAPGLFLIPALGLTGTAVLAALVNVTVGLLVLYAGASLRRTTPTASQAARVRVAEDPPVNLLSGLGRREFGLLAFASGFNVLLMEVGWARLSRLVLGNRMLAVSTLLFVVLLALGTASLAHKPLMRRLGGAGLFGRRYLTVLLAVMAFCQLLFAGLGIALAENVLLHYGLRVTVFLAAMVPPFFVAGLLFPWLLTSFPELDRRTGSSVGFLYATNVGGSTAGALVTTFVLIESLGTALTMLLGSGLLAGLALWLGGSRESRYGPSATRLALGGAWIGCALWLFPRHVTPVPPGQDLLAYRDDRYGIQVLTRDSSGMLLIANNNLQLIAPFGAPSTTYAQHLQADLPMLLATHTKRVFNLGTGYGITAGAVTLWGNQYEELVSVEILPFVLQLQERFRAKNFSFYAHPRTRLVRDDGRHLLLSSGRKYDVITLNPVDPRLPGSASMSTVEFWHRVREHLEPGGVYVQLVWDPQTKVLVQGFREVFPNFLMFRAYASSYVLVGYESPAPIPPFRTERITPEVREAYRHHGIDDLERFLGVLREIAETDTERWVREIERSPEPLLHSSDRPLLEYSRRYAPAFRTPDEEW